MDRKEIDEFIDATDEKKLEDLLALTIADEDRDIYRKRYRTNSTLIEQMPETKKEITEKITKNILQLDTKKIGKKIFAGKDAINGQEYEKNKKIIEKYFEKENIKDL